jgi:hypothetical protein
VLGIVFRQDATTLTQIDRVLDRLVRACVAA